MKTRMKKLRAAQIHKAPGDNIPPPAGEDLPVEGDMPSSEPPSSPCPPTITSPRHSTFSASPRLTTKASPAPGKADCSKGFMPRHSCLLPYFRKVLLYPNT